MVSNYFFLNRLVQTEAKILQNSLLTRITSQDANSFVFAFASGNGVERFWEVKLDGLPYLIPREKFKPARKNYAVFYSDFLPAPVISVQIAEGDRIFKITLTTGELVFFFKGNSSQLLFKSTEGNLFNNRFKVDDNEEFQAYFNRQFTGSSWFPSVSPDLTPDDTGKYNLKQIFVGFGKEIQDEYDARMQSAPGYGALLHLSDILNEVYSAGMVLSSTYSGEYTFIPKSFVTVRPAQITDEVTEPADILYYLIRENAKRKNFVALRKDVLNGIEEKIRYFSKKIENTSIYLQDADQFERYKLYGDLLAINRDMITQGTTTIEVNDIIAGKGSILIPLKADLTPQQNIENYYKKSRNAEIALKRAQEVIPGLQMNLLRFTKVKEKVESTTDYEELKNISMALGMNKQNKSENYSEGSKFRRFKIDEKYLLFVGKDSHNNDELTVKFAHQNDLWFHARSVPGSHCVLRSEDGKGGFPKEIIKKAASIAAYYSKSKTAKLAPVSYTEKKYVVKRKGLNPGQVMLMKEQSIIVPPEIPVGCVQIGSESDLV